MEPYFRTTMDDITTLLTALTVAALLKYTASRLFFERVNPAVQLNQRRFKRIKERIDELDASLDYQLTNKIYAEEGWSSRPLAKLISGHLAIWLIALVGSWVALVHMGGVLSEPVWWVAWVFIGGKMLIVMLSHWRKTEQRWSVLGYVAIASLVVVAPVATMYSLAPVGVVVFAIIYWCLSWVLWRVFPYNKGDVPKVAMLLL